MISKHSIPLKLDSSTLFQEKIIDFNQLQGSLYHLKNQTIKKFCILISGSGPTDRDGNQPYAQNNSLKQLSYHLIDASIASFRYDKRGVAASQSPDIEEYKLSFDMYVDDLIQWIAYFKKHYSIEQIYLIGHSEGALLAILAAQHMNVSGIILLAGTAIPAGQLIKWQLRDKLPSELSQISNQIIESLEDGQYTASIPNELAMLYRSSVQPFLISWFKYHPIKELQKLTCPILIVQGTSDLQIPIDHASLMQQAHNATTLKIIPNMNHVLKLCDDSLEDNLQSYNQPKRPISTELLKNIISFIKLH